MIGMHPLHRPREASAIERRIATAALATFLLAYLVLVTFLIVRRLAGAFVQPPAGAVVLVLSLQLALVSHFAKTLLLRSRLEDAVRRALPAIANSRLLVVRLLLVIPVGLAAAGTLGALTSGGSPIGAVAAAWLTLVASEFASVTWLLRDQLHFRETLAGQRSAATTASPATADDCEPELPTGLIQQLTRVREGERESIHGLLKAEILPGDCLAILHVAFCPPLAERPVLSAHCLEGEGLDVRITQAEAFGARLEVRTRSTEKAQRSEPTPPSEQTPRSVVVEMLGSAICR